MLRALDFRRLGLAGRLVLIVALAVMAALALGGGLAFLARERRSAGATPLPEQIAAIVGLAERIGPGAGQVELLAALSGRDLAVTVASAPPAVPATHQRLGAVEWLVGQHLAEPKRHQVIAVMDSGYPGRPVARLIERLSPISTAPLTIAVSLKGGDWIIIATRGSPAGRVFGVPAGFWLGVFGALLALLAVRAVMREARPLSDLEASVTAFAADATPRTVKAGGAPDLERVIAATNDMQSRISELIRSRGVLLAAISHDLRTFLTRLRLRVEDIPDEAARAKAVRDLDDMTLLLDDSLAIARGRHAADRREAVDFGQLVATEVASLAGAKVRLVTPLPATKAMLSGDPVALRRLVVNLIDNASRYGTRVEVRVDVAAPSLRLLVDDDGPGIPEAERERVFEPFHRGDPSRSRATGGSGLGLAIARQIVEAHGGTIHIAQSPMGGAQVVAELPVVAGPAAKSDLSAPTSPLACDAVAVVTPAKAHRRA